MLAFSPFPRVMYQSPHLRYWDSPAAQAQAQHHSDFHKRFSPTPLPSPTPSPPSAPPRGVICANPQDPTLPLVDEDALPRKRLCLDAPHFATIHWRSTNKEKGLLILPSLSPAVAAASPGGRERVDRAKGGEKGLGF